MTLPLSLPRSLFSHRLGVLMSMSMAMAVLPVLLAACSSSDSSTTVTDGGANGDTGTSTTSDAGSDTGTGTSGALSFTPSNIDLSGMDLSNVGDVIISGANCGIIDTETPGGIWSCVDANKIASKIVTLPDQTRLAIYVMKSLRVETSSFIDVSSGQIPLAIVALDKMTLVGSIKVRPGKGGGAYNALSETKGAGLGGGGGGPASNKAAGGGGSFCGIGGQGTAEVGGTPYPKSTGYGTSELVPLIGGSAGGAGAIGAGTGSGGGALQLVAGTSIELQGGAFISVPGGGGGQGGLAGSQEASGGGSGGAILLESPTVTIAGVLAANGGGGGEGAGGDAAGGASGDVGHDSDALVAKGGAAGTNNHGGNGGAGDTADGTDALSTTNASASGGGGGAGRIRINTSSGQAAITSATLSPSSKTACFTQGALKKK